MNNYEFLHKLAEMIFVKCRLFDFFSLIVFFSLLLHPGFAMPLWQAYKLRE